MLTGLALVLSCPFCGGRKEVMNVVSGNTGGCPPFAKARAQDYEARLLRLGCATGALKRGRRGEI